MSIKDDIAQLEERLQELRLREAEGFYFAEVVEAEHYHMRDDHEAIYDTDGNLAGIVINVKVIEKYMESLK